MFPTYQSKTSSTLVGLWLNDIPEVILKDQSTIQELCSVILGGRRAKDISTTESALLITLGESFSKNFLGFVAQKLRAFLTSRSVSREELDNVTLSSYTDKMEWDAIKEQITIAVNTKKRVVWKNKPLEDWSLEDTLQWLRDRKLEKYSASFKKNDIYGETLLDLTERDLRDIGISSLGHRKAFMRFLNEARKFRYEGEHVLSRRPDNMADRNTQLKSSVPTTKYSRKIQTLMSGKSVIVRGLSQKLMKDDDTMFDVENLVFAECTVRMFKPSRSGIVVTFDIPLTDLKRAELREKCSSFLQRSGLEGELTGELTIDFYKDGKVIPSSTPPRLKREIQGPLTTNYWTEFWHKLTEDDDAEDFFDDEESKLNFRSAREVLATIREVGLKSIKKNDPGIKYLKGFRKSELEALLSKCKLDVKDDIQGKKKVDIPRSEENDYKSEENLVQSAGSYVGMHIEGLPRFITDDDHFVDGIQKLVFRNIPVQRMIVLDEEEFLPVLKVEFVKWITSEKIPFIAGNLKTYLRGSKVDEQMINNVKLSCLEWEDIAPNGNLPQSKPESRRSDTNDDFLVSPGQSVQITRTILIEGIPEFWLKKESFLKDMPHKVFDGITLEDISVPPRESKSGKSLNNCVEVRFKDPFNLQRLPMVALKLKKFLKNENIPPQTVDGITIQVWHEQDQQVTEEKLDPVVGLIFKGIPSQIITNFGTLFALKNEVLTVKHTARVVEPHEEDNMLRIALEIPIYKKPELSAIALRLKKFLAKRGVCNADMSKVVVMSFSREKWAQLILSEMKEGERAPSQNEYWGVMLENMPASILDSHIKQKAIEKHVFETQKVIQMNIVDTNLRVTFGVPANSKAIGQIARSLKRVLSRMTVPLSQINKIVVAPQSVNSRDILKKPNKREAVQRKMRVSRTKARLMQNDERFKESGGNQWRGPVGRFSHGGNHGGN